MSKTSTVHSGVTFFRSVLGVIAGAMMLTASFDASAQLVYNEGFDQAPTSTYSVASGPAYTANYTTLMPFGWISGKYGAGTDLDNRFDRTRYSTFPNCTARTSTGMLRFISDYITSGEASFASSKRLDFQAWSAGSAATASFYMYRDNTAGNDNIKVYISNHPDPSLATSLILLTETASGLTTINRPSTAAPIVTVTGSNTVYAAADWKQYSYNLDLPAALGSFPSTSRDSVYITIIATSASGNNIYIDDFSVTSWPNLMTYNSSGLSFQNSATTAASATNQLIVGGYIRLDGESTPFSLANITFNWNGTTSPATDIQNAKLWYTGGSNSWDPTTAQQLGATIANPHLSSNMTWAGPYSLTHGDNYFWITYDIRATAISGNCVDAEFVSFDLQRTKTGASCAVGDSVVTLSNTIGITAGMSVVGLAQTVESVTSGTTLELNAPVASAIAGSLTFYVTQTPSPATLAGCRLIDFLYCVANMSAGTSWAGYTNNDYVSGVLLNGDNTPNNGIYTGRHWISYPTTCVNTGNYNINPPNAGDCAGSSTGCSRPWAQTSCPFTTHPPDYELMPQTTYRTTSMKADGTTNYTLQAWVGTWYGANYLAAWMDLNKDGTLNDNLMITTYSAAPGSAGANQVIPTTSAAYAAGATVLNVPFAGVGIVVGRPVWGPGIQPGTTVAGWANPNLTLSLPLNAAIPAGSPIYTGIAGGEKLFQSPGLANGGTFTCNFAVPTTSASGLMRLRVREVYAVSTITSCGGWTWGETEDYIVTIIPPCNTAAYGAPPGYNKVWLGFTDDWDNPLNWCPTGVPTLSDNAFIPPYTGGTVAPYRPGNKHPLIKPNVNATSGRLRIADSLSVDAYTNSSLIVADSLVIQTNKVFRITTAFKKDAQLLNGTLPLPTFYAPFRDGNKVRALILMRPGDFAGQGVIPGDVIDTMLFYVQRQATSFATAYTGVTIKYSLVNPTTLLPGAFGTVPAYVSGPWTIFSGNINATGAAANTWLTLTIPLIPGSFVYPSTTNYLMFEICYDNNGAAGGGTLNFQHTQIVGSSLYGVVYGTPGAAPCSMIPNDAANPATWYTNQYRPNITFRFRRPYIKYPIESRRNWINDGVFTAGISRVTMTGASAIGVPNTYAQAIGGTSQTTFFDLVINNTQHVTRQTNFTVTDTLSLLNGRLKLNGGTVTLTNPSIGGLYRTNGFLESETTGPLTYGDFRWNMTGTSLPSSRTIPFVNAAGTYIPLTYNMTAGSHDVTFATYATPANNSPLPNHSAGPPGPVVNNINGYATGADNSMNMIDRYWKVYNATPAGATVDLTMTWAATENTSGAGTYLGQRWLNNAGSITPGPGWEYPFIAGQTPGATSITLPAFSGFASNIWWAAVKDIAPLPVDLLNFTAKPVGSQVRLNWSTAAEFNNEKFIIERTVNMNDWSFIDEVPSRGNSVVTQYYETWDENPVNGLQYYTLRQFDIGGKLTTYGPVAVDMTRKMFGIVSASVQSSANGITLIFNYDSNEPYSVEVVDMLGRVVGASSNNPGNPGMNVMDIKADLSSGIYQVILRNSSQVDTKKIFY